MILKIANNGTDEKMFPEYGNQVLLNVRNSMNKNGKDIINAMNITGSYP